MFAQCLKGRRIHCALEISSDDHIRGRHGLEAWEPGVRPESCPIDSLNQQYMTEVPLSKTPNTQLQVLWRGLPTG